MMKGASLIFRLKNSRRKAMTTLPPAQSLGKDLWIGAGSRAFDRA